jgi:hypothetical protein
MIRLVASMMVGPGELHRYLSIAVEHAASYCDEVRIRWEGLIDADTTFPGADGLAPISILARRESTFYGHEGRARQELLDWTLEANPTHVLAIDADELVADPSAVRAACERGGAGAYHLCMQEVWNARPDGLDLRMDGGWGEGDVPILWEPGRLRGPLVLPDRALACGRTPTALNGVPRLHSCSAILHFGWANRAERAARYQRYVIHDGGRFHAKAHLDSIMYGDDRVETLTRAWPDALAPWKRRILAKATPDDPRQDVLAALADGPKSSGDLGCDTGFLRAMAEDGLVAIDPDRFPGEFVPGNPFVVRLPGDERPWPKWATWNV